MAWLRRLSNTFGSRRHWRDLKRELEFHLAERAEGLRADGVEAGEADRLARLRFGNYDTQLERTRVMDINVFVEGILRNLRHAVRALARSPLFTVTVLLVLALGIGANSAVFSAIDAVLLRPLAFPDGDQLVQLTQLQEALVAPRFFAVLGVTPVLGRVFSEPEEHVGGPNAMIISDRLWRRRFNAD